MKKLFTLLLSLCLACTLFLTGCVNESMADKINEKAQSEKGYTYHSLLQDYENPTIDTCVSAGLEIYSGTVIYVKGCKDINEVNEKLEQGKELKAIYVVILFNVVKSATYKEYTK